MNNKFLTVKYKNMVVGILAQNKEGRMAFAYDDLWLKNGFSISPFFLPLEKKVFIAPETPFLGNFGIFEDSIPDGWTKLLIDKFLISRGISLKHITTLDRLAVTGKYGFGALEYYPNEYYQNIFRYEDVDLSIIHKNILNIGNISKDELSDYLSYSGSSNGARPKINVLYNNEEWLIKFPSNYDNKNIGVTEYEYSILARQYELDVSQTKLFDKRFFGTKRFDREKREKIFMISAAALLNKSHKVPSLDYIELINATIKLTGSFPEAMKVYRLMCFNVKIKNFDDHSKNFSFLYKDGKWIFSPCYDILPSSGLGEHFTSINSKGKDIFLDDLLEVGKICNLPMRECKKIINEFFNRH